MPLPDTPTLTVEQTADILGVAAWTLYQAIRSDTAPVPVIRVGKRILVPTEAVRRLLRAT